MSRTLLRALSLVLCAAAVAAGASVPQSARAAPAPTTPAGVLYGLGDGAGQFARCADTTAQCCYEDPGTCPAGSVTGYWDNPWFRALASPHSAHRLRYVRLFVSIDAVAQYNGSSTAPGCAPSQVLRQPWTDIAHRAQPAGESLQDLVAGLVEAHADGLIPVVSLSGYPIASSRPSFSDAAPDPTTPAGYWSYRCGIEGILGALARLPTDEQPHIWEPFNEPDRVKLYSSPADAPASSTAPGCAVTPAGIPDGAAKAACLYVMADELIHGFAGHASDTLLAGVFSRLSPVYLEQYAAQLAHVLPATAFPTQWAVHDYGAVTRAYQGHGASLDPLAAFDRDLGTDTGGRAASLWITETGMLLTSRSHVGHCPAVGADPAGTIGACINGNGPAQLADLVAFLQLSRAGSSVPITHVFWYEWQAEPAWDSGLTDAAGLPRPGWCALYGSGSCAGSIDAP
jgi:hypothetical protein